MYASVGSGGAISPGPQTICEIPIGSIEATVARGVLTSRVLKWLAIDWRSLEILRFGHWLLRLNGEADNVAAPPTVSNSYSTACTASALDIAASRNKSCGQIPTRHRKQH